MLDAGPGCNMLFLCWFVVCVPTDAAQGEHHRVVSVHAASPKGTGDGMRSIGIHGSIANTGWGSRDMEALGGSVCEWDAQTP